MYERRSKAIPFYPELLIPSQQKSWTVSDTTEDPYSAWVDIYDAQANLVYPYTEELTHILRHENAHVGYTRTIADYEPHFNRGTWYWHLATKGFEELRVNAISFHKGIPTGLAWDLLKEESPDVCDADPSSMARFFESFGYRYSVARNGKPLPLVLSRLEKVLAAVFAPHPATYSMMQEAALDVWQTPTVERVIYWVKKLMESGEKEGILGCGESANSTANKTPNPAPGEGPPGNSGELTDNETETRPSDDDGNGGHREVVCAWDLAASPEAMKGVRKAKEEAYDNFLKKLESSGGVGSPVSPEIDLQICTVALSDSSRRDVDNYGGIRPRSKGGIPGPTLIGTRWGLGKTVFAAPARRGMSVCIDASGSMSWTADDLSAIVREIPAANIFMHSGTTGVGHICWLVKNGKGATSIPRDDCGVDHRPGGNCCDAEALAILGSLQGPRIWLSDGQVCGGVLDDRNKLYEVCQGLMDKYRIVRVANVAEIRKLLKGEVAKVFSTVKGTNWGGRDNGKGKSKSLTIGELPR